MNRFFLSFCLGTLLLSACSGWSDELVLRDLVEAELTLHHVSLMNDDDIEVDSLTFTFDISRPALGLSTLGYPDDMREEDLPLSIQTESIYLSGLDDRELGSGSWCHSGYSPHPCEFEVDEYTQPYLLKIQYKDGDYSITELEVPIPEALPTPTIVSPVKTPEQNSTFEVQFEDVGADTYEVQVSNCGEYNDDGINPCGDDQDYTVTMEAGEPEIFLYDWEEEDPYQPSVSMKDGVITLKSDFRLKFTVSVDYWIQAGKSLTNEGVETYMESDASLSLSL